MAFHSFGEVLAHRQAFATWSYAILITLSLPFIHGLPLSFHWL